MQKSRSVFLTAILLLIIVLPAKSQRTANADIDKSKLTLTISEDKKASETVMMADSLLSFAEKYLKTPYRLGANGTSSFDCSGFSSYVYKNFGYSLTRTASGQAQINGISVARDSLQRGDLVFFKGRNAKQNRVGHVGIIHNVLPDGTFTFIHASCKYGVTISEGKQDYYRTRYVTAKRILE